MNWIEKEFEHQRTQKELEAKLDQTISFKWREIIKVINQDVSYINENHLDKIRGLPIQFKANSHHLIQIMKPVYPAYYIDVELKRDDRKISIKYERVENEGINGKAETKNFIFKLNENQELIITSGDDLPLSLETISQIILMPTIRP